MEIMILKRIKDSFGKVVSFDISIDGGKSTRIGIDVLLSWKDSVINAICINNEDFRAKKGYHIDTEVLYDSLLIANLNAGNLKYSGFNSDYFGKGYESVCRKIRKFASIGKIVFDDSKPHESNRDSLNLINAINACGVDSRLFIITLLQYLQPYCLFKFQGEKDKWHGKDDIWLYDLGYKIKIVMKFRMINNSEMLVISFHESVIRGRYLGSNIDFKSKPCAVFIDDCFKSSEYYDVCYSVQLGFIRETNINTKTKFVNGDLALVSYSDFSFRFYDRLSREYQRICDVYNNSVGFAAFQNEFNLSFMSYGYGLLNNISMLIDVYSMNRDSRLGMEILDVANSVIEEASIEKIKELKLVLIQKYGLNYDNKLFKAIVG